MDPGQPDHRAAQSAPTAALLSGEKQFAWLASATLLLFVGVATYASFSRGLWLDEAWSILEGQHDLPLSEVVQTRWLTEISPPFFYVLSWIFQPLTGDGVFARRLLNLLPLILPVLAFVMLWRRYPHRSTLLLLLGLLVVSHPAAITYFPEHRAYFAILAGSTVLAAALSVIILEGTDYDRRDRGPLFVAFAGMLGVFSLHYIVAFQVGAVVAIVIVCLWIMRLRRWSVALALAAFVAGLPIVLTFVAQRQVLQGFGDKGWIRTEPTIAIFILGLVIGTSLLTSGIAAVAASRQLTARTSNEALKRFGVIMSVALVGSWALLMIANWRQPMVIERYLIAYIPFILALIAVFAADTIAADKVFRWAVALFAIALIVVNGT